MGQNFETTRLEDLGSAKTAGDSCTLIVGSGLSGLAAAVKIRRAYPEQGVVVVEKQPPQSNTLIAGQRFCAGIAGLRQNTSKEIETLLGNSNDGVITPQMAKFAQLAEQELDYWLQQPNPPYYEDKVNWFGPRIGRPNRRNGFHGKSMLNWFREQAQDAGVQFVLGDAYSILRDDNMVVGVEVESAQDKCVNLVADRYVFASGGVGGRLFLSTNIAIARSAQELAFKDGHSLVDSTAHMVHPFGKCDQSYEPKPGCFGTDELADATVYLGVKGEKLVLDEETTELLRQHQAHYNLPEIVERFKAHGGVVMMQYPDGSQKYACVSYHQSHLAIETDDGVSITGATNAYAVGDASGFGYWTEHHVRQPGFGLLTCLTDAAVVVEAMGQDGPEASSGLSVREVSPKPLQKNKASESLDKAIREINTHYLHQWLGNRVLGKSGLEVAHAWHRSIGNIADLAEPQSVVHDISLAVARAHMLVSSGEHKEPIRINANTAGDFMTA